MVNIQITMDINKLNLGCGEQKMNGFIGIDSSPKCNPDYCWDLTKIPYPKKWTKDIEYIRADNLIEHFEPKIAIEVINEWNRIMVKGGVLWIRVPCCKPEEPFWDSCFRDPTHVNYFTEATFDYWDINSKMERWQNFGKDYGIIPWKRIRQVVQSPFLIVELEKI